MLMMRAPAVRIMRSRSRAEAASSNLLALHRAVQKPAPTPHGTRARFAAIHRLISSFRVRAGDSAHHEHQRDPRDVAEEGRRRWRASLKGFAFTASPSSGGHGRAHKRGPPRCPIYACMWEMDSAAGWICTYLHTISIFFLCVYIYIRVSPRI